MTDPRRGQDGARHGVLDGTLAVLREVALTAGAVAGVACLVLALLATTAGVRALTFTSGSMAPTIRTGDLAITRPVAADRLAVGDVVSVIDPRGVRITHRVVGIEPDHRLRLKGDANAAADALPYAADRVDRVVFAMPAGGRVLARPTGPTGTLLLGAYLAFLLWVLRPRARRAGPVALLVVGLALGGAPSPERTLAAWTDPVRLDSTTLAASTVPKPEITGCTGAVGSVTVTWSAVASPYPFTYRAVVTETGQVLTVTGTGGTRSARYPTAQLGINTTHTVAITAVLPTTPSWVSAPANQTVRIGLLGLAPACGAAA